MSVILGIATACILIIWGLLRTKKQHTAPVLVRRYIHPGHAWMRETEDGDVLVGIDDFAQAVVGTVREVELPRLLKHVKHGEAAWRVRHHHRLVPFVSPVT